MTIDHKSRDGKLQCNIKRAPAKISALSSSKAFGKTFRLFGHLGNALEKRNKQNSIDKHDKNQVEPMQFLLAK